MQNKENRSQEELLMEIEKLRLQLAETEALHSQIELEKLIAVISTKFIISPREIDYEINNALKAIGEFSGVDRSYVFQFYNSGKKMDNTHEWCKEDIEPQIDILKGIEIEEEYPNFTLRIRKLEVIHVPKVVNLSPEAHLEKENFQMLGIKSVILVPIVYGQTLIGFLGFDSVKTEKTWKEDDIRLLKMVGEIFANALERKRAEQEIQKLQNYNRRLIEVSLDPLVTFDQEGIIMDVNEAKIQVTGRTREELIGTPFANYFTDPEKAYKGVMLVFETGEVRDYELVIVTKDGTEITVAYNASIYKDEKGKVVGAFGVARDITEYKKVKKELIETIERLELYTTRVNSLLVTMLEHVTDKKTNVVILDIAGVAENAEIAEPLVNIARLSKLLGATCIVTSIKLEEVRKLTDLGVSLVPITTERSLKEGLRYTIVIVEENDTNRTKKTSG